MPRAQFGITSYERGNGDLPELPVVNMFADEAPTEEGGIALQSRPGLSATPVTMGTGPVRGLFKSSGVLSGQLYGVSDGMLYEGAVAVANVGNGPVSWGGFSDRVFVNAGGAVYEDDGSSVVEVPLPDDINATAITVGSSRLLAIGKNTQTFYWSDSLTSTVDSLSFATAESSPDKLLDILYLDDAAILFGGETIEFWPNTGDNELPFQPLEGRVIERGVRNTGACCHIGSSFAWVTNENQVCVQSEDNVISNTGLQRRIEASETCELFRFVLEGNEFVALRLDGETQVYSRRSGMWSEFQTYGLDNWLAQCWAGGVFGGSDGSVLEWGDTHADAPNSVHERRFRAGVPLDSGGVVVGNIALRTNPGNTTYLTGAYADPTVEMRQSRDNGKTWGSWTGRSLGEQGQYRKNVQWRACGMASKPGWLGEFRVTDPVPFRVSGVLMNEPYGGRP